MIELREYTSSELLAYMKCSDNEGLKRKMKSYGISYTTDGKGSNAKYTITSINDYFKVFAVLDMDVPAQTDFVKFKYFMYEVLCDDEFNGMGPEMMEEYLRKCPISMSRQTISKYLKRLTDYGLIAVNGDFVYYRVYKKYGVQTHEIISKEKYNEAWKIYFDQKNKGYDSSQAFKYMYNWLDGAPRKQARIEQNGIYNTLIDMLTTQLIEEYEYRKDKHDEA